MIRRRRRERRRTSLRKMTDEDAARARAVVKGAPPVPDRNNLAGVLSDQDSNEGPQRVEGNDSAGQAAPPAAGADDVDPTEGFESQE